jgi:hypothetical protein
MQMRHGVPPFVIRRRSATDEREFVPTIVELRPRGYISSQRVAPRPPLAK